ncbi:MAG: PQQ-binding-like beta-propeller repeat protein, partial [Bacteroidetes bacterium]|nr:PQQ-binding-like beta-propeller repeat protein [Bacteroidota bacterium]
RVLVATRNGEIHTVDLASGRTRGFKQVADVFEGSPVIHDGVLYVPAAWGRRVLVAFDLARGDNRWRRSGVPFATSLVAHGDEVVGVDVEGTLRAFGTEKGEEVWTLSLGDHLTVKASPVQVSDSDIVVADAEGGVRRIDLDTRSIVWEKVLPAPVHVSPAADQDLMVVTTTRGSVHALDVSSGTEVWTFEVASHVRLGAPALGADAVYAGATDGRIRSLDRETGKEKWSTAFDDVITAPPLLAGSTLFVGTLGSELFALDASSGNVLWSTELKGRLKSAMAVADGGLLILTEPKWVVYYKAASLSGGEDTDD